MSDLKEESQINDKVQNFTLETVKRKRGHKCPCKRNLYKITAKDNSITFENEVCYSTCGSKYAKEMKYFLIGNIVQKKYIAFIMLSYKKEFEKERIESYAETTIDIIAIIFEYDGRYSNIPAKDVFVNTFKIKN
jgi:hypothetical protein